MSKCPGDGPETRCQESNNRQLRMVDLFYTSPTTAHKDIANQLRITFRSSIMRELEPFATVP
jgi:hypothetical protein